MSFSNLILNKFRIHTCSKTETFNSIISEQILDGDSSFWNRWIHSGFIPVKIGKYLLDFFERIQDLFISGIKFGPCNPHFCCYNLNLFFNIWIRQSKHEINESASYFHNNERSRQKEFQHHIHWTNMELTSLLGSLKFNVVVVLK